MKPNLLNDILEEGDYQQFRDDLCARFRAESRQRRHRKMMVFTITAMAASIAILATLALLPGRRNSAVALKKLKGETVPIIRSTPLPAAELLVTEQARVDVVEGPAMVITFTTATNPDLQSIDDSQLLAIFSDHPAGLVQTSAGERLVFIDPVDRQTFMGSN